MDTAIQEAHAMAVQCIDRAYGITGVTQFFDSLGVTTEDQAAARLADVERNKEELLALNPKLFRLLADEDTAEQFRRAHYELRTELPKWLDGARSAHEAVLSVVDRVISAVHNAPLREATALGKWRAIVLASRAVPQLPLVAELDREYHRVLETAPMDSPPDTLLCKLSGQQRVMMSAVWRGPIPVTEFISTVWPEPVEPATCERQRVRLNRRLVELDQPYTIERKGDLLALDRPDKK